MKQRKKKRELQEKNSRTTLIVPQGWLTARTPAVLAVAYLLVMVIIGFTYHKIGDYGVETDFYWAYVPNAKHILEGKLGVDPFKGPGYDLVLAAAGAVVGDFFSAGMLISLLSAAGVLFLTYRLLARLFSTDTAFLVSVALATNFVFLKSSYTAGTDMFFDVLAVAVLYLLLRRDEFRLADFVAAGIVTGFAYVTRYNGVAFYLAAVVGLLLLNYKGVGWHDRVRGVGAFIGSSLVFVVPWGLYCMKETGKFFYNHNHLNIAYEMFGKGKVGWDEYWTSVAPKFKSYLDVVAASPSSFFKQIGVNAYDHFWRDVSQLVGLPMGIFALGGILALIIQKIDRKQAMYFVYSMAFYTVLLPVFYGERFSLFLAPTIILLSICFFQWKSIPSIGFSSFRLKNLVLLGAMVFTTYSSVQQVSSDIGSGPTEILEVRDAFFRSPDNVSGGRSVVARKPQIAYYLNMKYVPFPYVNTMEDLIAELKKSGANYLFYSWIEAGMRPQFRYLLDPRNAPVGFRPIVQFPYPPAVLYELKIE